MKLLIKLSLFASLLTIFSIWPSHAQALSPEETAKKEMIEKMKKEYPLETCVVSGDKFGGEMGEPIEYLHEETGKPARLVRFCCKGCIKSFKKEPAKYLKLIDDAAAKKKTSSTTTPAVSGDGHDGHKH